MFQVSGQGPYYGQASWLVPRKDSVWLTLRFLYGGLGPGRSENYDIRDCDRKF